MIGIEVISTSIKMLLIVTPGVIPLLSFRANYASKNFFLLNGIIKRKSAFASIYKLSILT